MLTHINIVDVNNVNNRYELLRKLRPTVDKLGMNTNTAITKRLVTGQQDITFNENVTLSVLVQDYIKNTKRFSS